MPQDIENALTPSMSSGTANGVKCDGCNRPISDCNCSNPKPVQR
jgi:hypothetical protein